MAYNPGKRLWGNAKKEKRMVLLVDFISVCVLSLALFTSALPAEEPKSALHDAKVTHDREWVNLY